MVDPDMAYEAGVLSVQTGIFDLGEKDSTALSTLEQIPAEGFLQSVELKKNHCYIIKTKENLYAGFHVVSIEIGARGFAIVKWVYDFSFSQN